MQTSSFWITRTKGNDPSGRLGSKWHRRALRTARRPHDTLESDRFNCRLQVSPKGDPEAKDPGRRTDACYLITRCVLTPAGPCAKRRLLLELPLLAAHRTDVAGLLGVQPLHDAVYVETMRALPPHWNKKSCRSRVKLISSSSMSDLAHGTRTWRWGRDGGRTYGRAYGCRVRASTRGARTRRLGRGAAVYPPAGPPPRVDRYRAPSRTRALAVAAFYKPTAHARGIYFLPVLFLLAYTTCPGSRVSRFTKLRKMELSHGRFRESFLLTSFSFV